MKLENDKTVLQTIVERMVSNHGCHTVLLYGSRATAEFDANSDYDICAFREEAEEICDCDYIDGSADGSSSAGGGVGSGVGSGAGGVSGAGSSAGRAAGSGTRGSAAGGSVTGSSAGGGTGKALLDAWIYPESYAKNPGVSMLRLRNARVLLEKDGLGSECIAKVNQLLERGPEPLPEWEVRKRKIWLNKTLARIRKTDLEGRYRALWLLHLSLEYYFELRGLWYQGSKESFKWLETNDPTFLVLFEVAVANPLNHEAVARVIQRVVEEIEQ